MYIGDTRRCGRKECVHLTYKSLKAFESYEGTPEMFYLSVGVIGTAKKGILYLLIDAPTKDLINQEKCNFH